MFSGIIQDTGIVKEIKNRNKLLELTISAKKIKDLKAGSSIAVDGCCLTVVDNPNNNLFKVQITDETLKKTNFNTLKSSSKVNLEPSLRLNDKLDGHLVLGHIDGTGFVCDMVSSCENTMVSIKYPSDLKQYIAPKGSITVNGVSLTVVDIQKDTFSFTLIPFTRNNTNLGLLKIDDVVNLEIDVISRYIVNYINHSDCLTAVGRNKN